MTHIASPSIYLRARYYDPATGRFLTRDVFPALATMPQSWALSQGTIATSTAANNVRSGATPATASTPAASGGGMT
jgi:hypothetical protein